MEKIFQVIEKNNTQKLRCLLSETGETEYVVDGWTPLTYACERGKEEMVAILIEYIKQSVSMNELYLSNLDWDYYLSTYLFSFDTVSFTSWFSYYSRH